MSAYEFSKVFMTARDSKRDWFYGPHRFCIQLWRSSAFIVRRNQAGGTNGSERRESLIL